MKIKKILRIVGNGKFKFRYFGIQDRNSFKNFDGSVVSLSSGVLGKYILFHRLAFVSILFRRMLWNWKCEGCRDTGILPSPTENQQSTWIAGLFAMRQAAVWSFVLFRFVK